MAQEEKDNKQQLENSAIGSWAGYIYQGVCGMIEAVRLIKDANPMGFCLSLDALEDFAILNEEGKAISLHQCKDKKAQTDYEEAHNLMFQVRDYLKEKNRLTDDVSLFFHCNKKVDIPEGISLYTFPNGREYCEPGNVVAMLSKLVEEYRQKEGIVYDSDVVVASLLSLVEKKVLDVQQKYFNSKDALKSIADEASRIPFSDIVSLLRADNKLILSDEVLPQYTKMKYVEHLKREFKTEWEDAIHNGSAFDAEKMGNVIDTVSMMSEKEWTRFLKRIVPDMAVDMQNAHNLCPNEKGETLFAILNKLRETVLPQIHWVNGQNENITPTAIRKAPNRLNRLIEDIYRNMGNLDVLYEYRWMVADAQGAKVDHIFDRLNPITEVKDGKEDDKPVYNQRNDMGLYGIEHAPEIL